MINRGTAIIRGNTVIIKSTTKNENKKIFMFKKHHTLQNIKIEIIDVNKMLEDFRYSYEMKCV